MMVAIFPPKCQFLQEPHGVTFRKTAFFKVTVVKTSTLTELEISHEDPAALYPERANGTAWGEMWVDSSIGVAVVKKQRIPPPLRWNPQWLGARVGLSGSTVMKVVY
jgi:hypothetical protein